jgi:hypothetical protein
VVEGLVEEVGGEDLAGEGGVPDGGAGAEGVVEGGGGFLVFGVEGFFGGGEEGLDLDAVSVVSKRLGGW